MKKGNFCPLLKKECIGLECAWITQIRGTNPNTGAEIDEWGCSIGWLPVLLVEGSNQQRHTTAAVESFRNETVRGKEQLIALSENKNSETKLIG
jgi:hypothetical protein